ncbi:MAG: DUF167 domain-containing protein [bacterium]|nr:DUF167 domain-containing protein [bacterium]
MKIFVKAKPNSRQVGITKIDEHNYIVAVKEPPIQGQANRAIEKLLADYFDVSPIDVVIISGHTSRQKIVEIIDRN